MKPVVNLYKLGRLPYVKALSVQQILFDKLKSHVTSPGYNLSAKTDGQTHIKYGPQDCIAKNSMVGQYGNEKVGNSLILVEHEPVYTIGIRSKQYNDKYVSRLKAKLDEHKLKADFVETNRGGLITFHGPGQLVAYPIIYLGDFKRTIRDRSIKEYVKLLEGTIIDTLASIGIDGAHTVKEHPGVWLDNGERKIAFIGIACKRFVTMHGISINCDCDLFWFDHIVSCGIEDKSITSIGRELYMKRNTRSWPIEAEKNEHGNSRIEDEPNIHHASSNSTYGFKATCSRGSKADFDSISRAFCASFSQRFDCDIREDLNLGNDIQHLDLN